jgi:hypothetical protein
VSRLVVLPLLLAPLAIAACGNTYHPEYHPVTLTNYEQHVAYPAGGPGGAPPPSVVFRAPPPPPPPTPAPWSAWPSSDE